MERLECVKKNVIGANIISFYSDNLPCKFNFSVL